MCLPSRGVSSALRNVRSRLAMRGLVALAASTTRSVLSTGLGGISSRPGTRKALSEFGCRPAFVECSRAVFRSQATASSVTSGLAKTFIAPAQWAGAPHVAAGLVTSRHAAWRLLVPTYPGRASLSLFQRVPFSSSSQPSKPPPGVGKIGHYIKELGLPFTLWWTGAWIISGFAVYALISSGLVGGGDAIDMLKAVGVGRIFDLDNITPGVGNLAVTIVINEALEIVRLPFVLATTPYIAKLIPKGRGGSASLSQLISTHGVPFLALWSGTWALSGVIIWGVLETGAMGGMDAITLLRALPVVDQVFNIDAIDPTMGNVAVAVGINECLEIVRLPLCIALAPRWGRLWARLFRQR